MKRSVLPTALASLGLVAAAQAQATIVVNADIATSTTWTANNIYNLASQIYVLPGATLTIEPGTVIASTANAGGSLCVTRGAQIFVNGTERNPVIMTSDADRATWVGGDPKTGTWRAACNEWGNLTICGRGYVSENLNPATNTATPNAANYGTMEGLTPAFPGDTRVYYGGGNDDDDSGNISYLSLRYGGKVVALTNELNGLSMGGVGRGTDVHHVEIMNNVDDGVEVWGGTVNFKHLSIWNVGDDSFDVDQGWRGRAQFGLIVQGYSVPAGQGSGWGDNAIEMDGAEQSDYQPVTTATIYNFTVIGCPTTPVTGGTGGTDHGIALRDNARVQFRNCIFTDIGERVLSFDNTDGDGGAGYGFNGTLTWAATWTTPYTATSSVNAPANPAAFYTVQTSGTLNEISDSVFYNNQHGTAYTEANARSIFAAANNNVQATSSPIVSIGRAAPVVVSGSNTVARVTSLNPLPQNDALTSVAYAPNDGFFEAARFRGAFAPGNNWLVGWTAADAFGFLVHDGWCDLGKTARGTYGAPVMDAAGTLQAGVPTTFSLSNAKENALCVLMFGFVRADVSLSPFGYTGVTLVPNFNTLGYSIVFTNASGNSSSNLTLPAGYSGASFYEQYLVFDAGSPNGLAASNAIYRLAQ
ncbi:MAG: hypothetical protein IT456_24080 [Planctomycetes bacterium]|nr:hypothetical protein [Planctomycetota bacterium]